MTTGRHRADRLVERLFVRKHTPEPSTEEVQPRPPSSVGARLEAIRNVRRNRAEFERKMKEF